MQNSKTYLKITNLNVHYKQQVVLQDVNFTLNAGEKIGIIGRNGAGKTTFIESIVGLVPISSGEIEFNDEIANNIASVFQEASFDRYLSIKQTYVYFLKLVNKQISNDVKSTFQKYGISNVMNKTYDKLSGGQKQRFKILMALESHPKLLLVDEFNNSIDYESRNYFINMIKTYLNEHQDCSLILISHDKHELLNLTSKQFLLENKNLTQTDLVQKND